MNSQKLNNHFQEYSQMTDKDIKPSSLISVFLFERAKSKSRLIDNKMNISNKECLKQKSFNKDNEENLELQELFNYKNPYFYSEKKKLVLMKNTVLVEDLKNYFDDKCNSNVNQLYYNNYTSNNLSNLKPKHSFYNDIQDDVSVYTINDQPSLIDGMNKAHIYDNSEYKNSFINNDFNGKKFMISTQEANYTDNNDLIKHLNTNNQSTSIIKYNNCSSNYLENKNYDNDNTKKGNKTVEKVNFDNHTKTDSYTNNIKIHQENNNYPEIYDDILELDPEYKEEESKLLVPKYQANNEHYKLLKIKYLRIQNNNANKGSQSASKIDTNDISSNNKNNFDSSKKVNNTNERTSNTRNKLQYSNNINNNNNPLNNNYSLLSLLSNKENISGKINNKANRLTNSFIPKKRFISEKKVFGSVITFENQDFPIYQDSSIGINNYWQSPLEYNFRKDDDDIDTDCEQISLATSRVFTDNALFAIDLQKCAKNKISCVENKYNNSYNKKNDCFSVASTIADTIYANNNNNNYKSELSNYVTSNKDCSEFILSLTHGKIKFKSN